VNKPSNFNSSFLTHVDSPTKEFQSKFEEYETNLREKAEQELVFLKMQKEKQR
jgi:hypothetical protein